ncbi:MAG: hypothetical protein CVT93_05565 [Bacteroidetes bacterium HGW-Bacteroidetes-10]|jgi:outer membrane lipoprotein-sorting protein|nr:MAG: hypothetical protein CVT93_05565 [Bacteroidetes bacterium HGW-Bacteroidetes-10]
MKIVLVVLAMFFLTSFGPETEEQFFNDLAKQSREVATVSGTFIQTKHIKVLGEKVESGGTFFYKRSGNVRFDYSTPKTMSIIMTTSNIHILSRGKATTFSLESQKGLSDLAGVMEACMGGNITSIPKTYKVTYELKQERHKLYIEPKNKNLISPYTRIELSLNKNNLSLEELILVEKTQDYTVYKFSSITLNRSLPATMFRP